MVNTKRKQVNRNKISLGKDEEKREFLCFAGWTVTGIVDPQKVKNRMIIWSSHSASRCMPPKNWKQELK